MPFGIHAQRPRGEALRKGAAYERDQSARPGARRSRRYNRNVRLRSPTAFVLLVVLVSAGLVAWRVMSERAAGLRTSSNEGAKRPVPVEVAPIERGVMSDVRVLSGTLAASTRFDVSTEISGLIRQINVDLGDEVERGQVVAVLDDDEFVQAVAHATAELAIREAELTRANVDLDRVNREFRRVQDLFERGIASDLEFDELTSQRAAQAASVALAEARLRQGRAALELAKLQLGDTSVRAAWHGGPERAVVAMRYADAGGAVQAGVPIVAIVGLDLLKAVVSVTEEDYARLQVGQAATLTTDARPGETFSATIERVAPTFQEASRQARIELRVDNPDRLLRPGMFVRIRVVLRESQADTIVPASAIVTRGERRIVFTVDADAGVAREHVVELGIVEAERVQIIGPRLTGDVVVLGQHLLDDGAAITITE